jgi:hypothetical protein
MWPLLFSIDLSFGRTFLRFLGAFPVQLFLENQFITIAGQNEALPELPKEVRRVYLGFGLVSESRSGGSRAKQAELFA